MNDETITLWNTILPILVLGGLGAAVPWLITPRGTRSHKVVALCVGISAALVVALSAMVMILVDRASYAIALEGGVLLVAEIALRGSWTFILGWGPLLLLSWFGLAQRVEALRGQDLSRGAV